MLLFKKMLIIGLLLGNLCANAETVYKNVDQAGNIIFTDKQTTDSTAIELQGIQTIKRTPLYNRPIKRAPKTEGNHYQNITITPAANSSLRSNDGSVSISVAITPFLREDDTLIIRLDGKQIAKGRAHVSLTNIDRGSHNIEATIFDRQNNAVISSSSSFSLLRASQ